MNKVQLIAHRGYSGKYPENTLIAYQAAYAHGARWMECDVQLTKDLTPIVQHDESLKRMSGVDVDIRTIKSKQLKKYSAYYPEKFGQDYIGNQFCSLKKLAKWLKCHSDVKLFVEVKQHSIDAFGLETCMKIVDRALKKVSKQCILISFNPDIVELARSKYELKMGWVIPEWTQEVKERAEYMQPNFLFTNKNIMPENPELWWQGGWHWANYNVDEVPELPEWVDKGLKFIETNEIGDMLKDSNMEKYNHG